MKRKCRKVHRKIKRHVSTNREVQPIDVSTSKKIQQQSNVVIKLPNLTDLEKAVNETVIGQEGVVKSVCTKIYEGLCFPNLKKNILLVGKSGTGKTEIVRQLAENLKVPCTIEDSTRYTEDGFVGSNVTSMISNLIREADGNLVLASQGIIFVDEIDKKAARHEFSSEVNKQGVLKGLLKMVEGTDVQIPDPDDPFKMFGSHETIKFNTSNIIFIFGGAFAGLDKIREERLKKSTKIGFASAEANHIVINNYMNTTFTKEDLIQYGLPAEFVGRISNIYETRELQIDDLRKILEYSKKSEFKKYESVFKSCGIELVYSKRLFELIAVKAKTTSTGARELNSLVSHVFEHIMYDAFSTAVIGNCSKCILEDDIVNDNTKYRWE